MGLLNGRLQSARKLARFWTFCTPLLCIQFRQISNGMDLLSTHLTAHVSASHSFRPRASTAPQPDEIKRNEWQPTTISFQVIQSADTLPPLPNIRRCTLAWRKPLTDDWNVFDVYRFLIWFRRWESLHVHCSIATRTTKHLSARTTLRSKRVELEEKAQGGGRFLKHHFDIVSISVPFM